MKKLKLAGSINLGPEVFITIYNSDDSDFVGVLAEMQLDQIHIPLLWLHECKEGGKELCNCPSSESYWAKDVADIANDELDRFVQRVREIVDRNGLRFDESRLSTMRD